MPSDAEVHELVLSWTREALHHAPTIRAVLMVVAEATEYALLCVPDPGRRGALQVDICTLAATRLRDVGGCANSNPNVSKTPNSGAPS
jgi:hypothetical protein